MLGTWSQNDFLISTKCYGDPSTRVFLLDICYPVRFTWLSFLRARQTNLCSWIAPIHAQTHTSLCNTSQLSSLLSTNLPTLPPHSWKKLTSMEDGTSLYEELFPDAVVPLQRCDASKSSKRGAKNSSSSLGATLRPKPLESASGEVEDSLARERSCLPNKRTKSSSNAHFPDFSIHFTHKLVFKRDESKALIAIPQATLDLLGFSVGKMSKMAPLTLSTGPKSPKKGDSWARQMGLCALHASAPGWAHVSGGLEGAKERANKTLDDALFLPGFEPAPYSACGLFSNVMQEVWALTTPDPPCTCAD